MKKYFCPRDYQRSIIDFGLDRPRCQVWAGTGTGKTPTALDIYCRVRALGEVQRCLVVGTTRIASLVWNAEVEKWADFAGKVSVAVAVGTPKQRVKALELNADITTINYENLPWLVEYYGDAWPFDMVIADEASKLKGLRIDRRTKRNGETYLRMAGGSVRAAALAKVAHTKVKRFINLTASPSAKGLEGLWGQMWFIDQGARLGETFEDFANRFFRAIPIGGSAFAKMLVPKRGAKEEIEALIRDVTITIDGADYVDLPPTVENIIKVKLPPKLREMYREMEKNFYIELGGREFEAMNSGTKISYLRQLAAGALYTDRKTKAFEVVHDLKFDALSDIVEELQGQPVIVAYQFKSDLARLQKAYPKAPDFDGTREMLDQFREGKIPIMFAHPASSGHGLDGMQDSCNNIVHLNTGYNQEEDDQINERIGVMRQYQSGRMRTVFIHRIVVEDTVDEDIVDSIRAKTDVQTSIKAAMKRRNGE